MIRFAIIGLPLRPFAVWCMLCLPLCAQGYQMRGREVLNPKTYRSPSGTYSLLIDPSNRSGDGPATYRLSRASKVVWQKTLPYTLLDAGVADNGVLAGYRYSQGRDALGNLELAILNPNGTQRRYHRYKRTDSRIIHAPPYPVAAGVIVDGDRDTLVLRVIDEGRNHGDEEWWLYRLTSGTLMRKITPAQSRSNRDPARYVISAQRVRGTGLTLANWWRFGERGELGARFTLVNDMGQMVWTTELPTDYDVKGDEDARNKLMNKMQIEGSILSETRPNRFAIQFVKLKKRVEFTVSKGAGGKWNVREIKREAILQPKAIVAPPIPEIQLRAISDIELKVPGQPARPPIHDVFAFTSAGPGRLAFIRREADFSASLIVVDERGQVVREVSLRTLFHSSDKWFGYELAWVGGERFVVTRPGLEKPDRSLAYWVDAESGQISAVAGFDGGSVDSIAGFKDGGFVYLGTVRSRYSMGHVIQAYDSKGKFAWQIPIPEGWGANEPPQSLLSPSGLAVTSEGNVVVVDVIRHKVQVFNRNGKYLSTIDLKKAWGKMPQYPSDIMADVNGGFVVKDYPASPPLYRMAIDGRIIGKLNPTSSDEMKVQPLDTFIVASNGRVWATNRNAIIGLDNSGQASEILGERANPNVLRDVQEVIIDEPGRIYALDDRTKACHVFGPDGKWLHVCRPEPDDLMTTIGINELTVSTSGKVFISGTKTGGYLCFGPDGQRIGVQPYASRKIRIGNSDRAAGGVRWDSYRLTDDQGNLVLELDRRPDRTWLELAIHVAMAHDGSLAVLDGVLFGGTAHVSLFSQTGKPISTFVVPKHLGAPYRIAFDGKNILLNSGKYVFCFDRSGKPLWKFRPDRLGNSDSGPAYISNEGRTLSIWSGGRTITSFEMPH